MICKNCNHKFEGQFCSYCGQNSKVQKIDFKYLTHEFSNSILQVNNGFLYTIKELFVRPGHTIREFLAGKRVRHFKPLAFVLVTSTIYVLTSYITNSKTVLGDFISGLSEGFDSQSQTLAFFHNTLLWFENNYAYSTLFTLLFFSFASFIVYRKSGYNYFEHIILNLYLTGQQTVIFLLLNSFYLVLNPENFFMQLIILLSSICYTFWVFIQFFQNRKRVENILRVILIYGLSAIFILVFFFIFWIIETAIVNGL